MTSTMTSSILENEVHIWFCRPETIQDTEKLLAYKSVLSVQEMERYNRFHFEKDKHSYLVSHALLRHSLSKYSSVDASQWQFSYNAHGKPELKQHAAAHQDEAHQASFQQASLTSIKFNLTHTDGLSACVVTIDRVCGIDAEYIYRKNSLDAVAQRMFAEEELKVLHEAGDDQYPFYRFWTLREAYVKALGTGLAGSSKEYYFSVEADSSSEAGRLTAAHLAADLLATERRTANLNFTTDKFTKISSTKQREDESSRWQFNLFKPTEEHCLAVAIESTSPLHVCISEFIP